MTVTYALKRKDDGAWLYETKDVGAKRRNFDSRTRALNEAASQSHAGYDYRLVRITKRKKVKAGVARRYSGIVTNDIVSASTAKFWMVDGPCDLNWLMGFEGQRVELTVRVLPEPA